MDVQFKARSLWNTGKEVTVKCTQKLSNGITFEEFFSVYASYLRVIVPAAIEHPVDCVVVFFLFHAYLAYVLVFSVSLAVLKRFKPKGAGIAPVTGALKEKAALLLTYFFVAQSLSQWTFSYPAFEKWMGWAFQVKPQINFKPQIKIGKSQSKESVVSVKSKVGTALHVGFESEDEDTRKSLKKLKKVSRSVDFAAEMADALLMGQESDTEDQKWVDSKDLSFQLEEEEEENSMIMVQKWLSDADAAAPDDLKQHVMRLVAENEQMRRQSLSASQQQTENKKDV